MQGLSKTTHSESILLTGCGLSTSLRTRRTEWGPRASLSSSWRSPTQPTCTLTSTTVTQWQSCLSTVQSWATSHLHTMSLTDAWTLRIMRRRRESLLHATNLSSQTDGHLESTTCQTLNTSTPRTSQRKRLIHPSGSSNTVPYPRARGNGLGYTLHTHSLPCLLSDSPNFKPGLQNQNMNGTTESVGRMALTKIVRSSHVRKTLPSTSSSSSGRTGHRRTPHAASECNASASKGGDHGRLYSRSTLG